MLYSFYQWCQFLVRKKAMFVSVKAAFFLIIYKFFPVSDVGSSILILLKVNDEYKKYLSFFSVVLIFYFFVESHVWFLQLIFWDFIQKCALEESFS